MGELSPEVTEGENPFRRTRKPAQIGRYVISPSVKTCGFATFLIRGRQGLRPLVPWLHLMGELSPEVTEGEKPLSQNPKTCADRQVRYLSFRQNLRFCHLPRQRKARLRPLVLWLHQMVRTEDPAAQGFGSGGAGIRRIRTGWSRAASSGAAPQSLIEPSAVG